MSAKNTRNAKSNARFEGDTVTISQLTLAVANELETDQTAIAKRFRARIRSNFDAYSKAWKGLEEAKDNRDGNRYPPMPASLANSEFERMTAKATKDDDES